MAVLTDRTQHVRESFRELCASAGNAIVKGEIGDAADGFASSTAAGLSLDPRRLECRYLYDAYGSALFDLITEQPEYYLTRAETQILNANASYIREITGPVTLVELGSGSSVKTDHLLRAWLGQGPSVTYVPVDVSESALREACRTIRTTHPSARVVGVHADYRDAMTIVREASPAMVLFLGSSIGNFGDDDAFRLLTDLTSCLSPRDFFLVGVDLVKEPRVIEQAYNDAAGVSAQFTRNLFARMNRELDAGIDVSAVEHVAHYDPLKERVDIFARFTREQSIDIAPLKTSFTLAAGEMIQTEISRKYKLHQFVAYLEQFGLETEATFTDERDWFALVLLKRRGSAVDSHEGRI